MAKTMTIRVRSNQQLTINYLILRHLMLLFRVTDFTALFNDIIEDFLLVLLYLYSNIKCFVFLFLVLIDFAYFSYETI